MTQRAIEIVWSVTGEHYYVAGAVGCQPKSWAPIKDSGDVLPFAFWDLRSGRREAIEREHPLVRRYAEIDGWPPRGTDEWRESLTRQLDNKRKLLEDTKRHVESLAESIIDLIRELETP